MKTKVYLESGDKRVFAGAIDWPGWARSGKTETDAFDVLLRYGQRYRASIEPAADELELPADATDFDVIARPEGGSGTDFGVPSAIQEFDWEPLSAGELDRRIALLRGAWTAFDRAAGRASGQELARGPRGGGRSLEQIVEHVRDAERSAYISQLGAKAPPPGSGMAAVHDAFIEALLAKVRGELPERGPRGGVRWPAAYAIRRAAWHVLDHAWEIEDRSS